MTVTNIRVATPEDAPDVYVLRRRSILELAPNGMSVEQARHWAEKGTVESMSSRLESTESWVAQIDGQIVGWVAIQDDYLDALYVAPGCTRRGIGTELLQLVEDVLRGRGVAALRVEASWNSEAFYIRRGYEPAEPRPPEGARRMRKGLRSARG